ncbi:MAG TPA: hypothetical protein VNS58_13285 [Puia sp.]|nr:hypothetical protein [Puia sp.]
MLPLNVKHWCALTSVALCLTLSTLASRAGLDSFEIYLNDKLLEKMVAGKAFSLESLRLDKSNSNDRLVIYYSQCNAVGKTGKERSISVKDSKGKILKEWKFADATGTDAGMTIPVKELLQLEKDKTGGALSLYYTAQGRPEGQLLASFS